MPFGGAFPPLRTIDVHDPSSGVWRLPPTARTVSRSNVQYLLNVLFPLRNIAENRLSGIR